MPATHVLPVWNFTSMPLYGTGLTLCLLIFHAVSLKTVWRYVEVFTVQVCGYWLESLLYMTAGWTTRVRFPVTERNFSLPACPPQRGERGCSLCKLWFVNNVPLALAPSSYVYANSNEMYVPDEKAAAWNYQPTAVEFPISWSFNFILPYTFVLWCFVRGT
jgi:hypothetical protein